MDTNKTKSIIAGALNIFLGVVILVFGFTLETNAVTYYPPGALLQPNDVTSSHIRDNTITPTDIDKNNNFLFRNSSSTQLETSTFSATSTSFLATTTAYILNVGAFTATTSAKMPATTFTGQITLPATGPTDGNHATTKTYVDSAGGAVTYSATAGQNILANSPVWVATTTEVSNAIESGATSDGAAAFGKITTTKKYAQSFVTGTAIIRTMDFRLKKTGTPTDNIVIYIVGGTPTAPNTALEIASTTLDGSSLTTSFATTTINFYPSVSLVFGANYWIVFYRDGAESDSNFYSLAHTSANSSPVGNMNYWDGGAWNNQLTLDLHFKITDDGTTQDYVYMSHGVGGQVGTSTIGIAPTATATSSDTTIRIAGTIDGFTGLNTLDGVYLSNLLGKLSTTAGNGAFKIGTAFASTTIFIKNPNF